MSFLFPPNSVGFQSLFPPFPTHWDYSNDHSYNKNYFTYVSLILFPIFISSFQKLSIIRKDYCYDYFNFLMRNLSIKQLSNLTHSDLGANKWQCQNSNRSDFSSHDPILHWNKFNDICSKSMQKQHLKYDILKLKQVFTLSKIFSLQAL